MTAITNPIVTTVQTGAGEKGLEEIKQFLYREARFLDDREFDRWIDCYHPEATFWMPAWADDDQLTEDPQREISLIYYANRGGLEDRVFRIKTDRSSATSLPEPRTGHNITNVEIVAAAAKTSIVQVGSIVDTGELDPENVVTPGIYVNTIVRINATTPIPSP